MDNVIGVSGNGWCMLRCIGMSSNNYKPNWTSWNSKGKRNSACMAMCEINVQESNSNLPNCNCPIDNKWIEGQSRLQRQRAREGNCRSYSTLRTWPMQSLTANWSSAPSHLILTGRPPAVSQACEVLLDRVNFSHKEQELVGKMLNDGGMAGSWLGLSPEAAWTCALWMVLRKVSYCAMRRTHYEWSEKYWFPGAIIGLRTIYGN